VTRNWHGASLFARRAGAGGETPHRHRPVQCWAVFVERWPVHHGIAGAARPCGVSAAVPETGLDRLAPAWGLSDTGVCFRNVKAGGPAHSEAIKRGIARARERFNRWCGPAQIRCWNCGNPFVYEGVTGRSPRYCSNACRQAGYRKRSKTMNVVAQTRFLWHGTEHLFEHAASLLQTSLRLRWV